MSMRPCPERLNKMTFCSPVCLHFSASRMTAAMACPDSGAGMMPSVRAKSIAASKDSSCGISTPLISPSFSNWEIIMPAP